MKKIKIKKIIPVAYSGSLIQQNFGETVSNHGFLIWDVEKRSFKEYTVENNYPLYNFKIKSIEDIENDKELITNL